MKNSAGEGVSPVIGVILMVAVCVALVAVAATVAFDLRRPATEPADVSADISYNVDTQEVSAEVLRNTNARKVVLRANNGSTEIVDSSEKVIATGVGKTGTARINMTPKNAGDTTDGTATVVAVVEDSTREQIVTSIQYETDWS